VSEGSEHVTKNVINYSNRRRKMIYLGLEATKRQFGKNFNKYLQKKKKMSKRGMKYFPEQIHF